MTVRPNTHDIHEGHQKHCLRKKKRPTSLIFREDKADREVKENAYPELRYFFM